MDLQMTLWLALIGGAVVAVAVGVIVITSYLHGERARALASMLPPDGVVQAMAALPFPAFVLSASNEVLVPTPAVRPLGMVSGDALTNERVEHLADAVRATGEQASEDLVLHRGRGEQDRHVTVHASVLGARYVLVVVEDRTRSVLAEQMRRDFTANVSHELKTPISAAMLLSEAIMDSAEEPATVRRFAGQLHSEVHRLNAMVRDIIALSRIESETEQFDHPEKVDLDAVIRKAVATCSVLAQAKGVKIVVKVTTGLATSGRTDMLVTAVQNLIANAVEYSPSGGSVGVSGDRVNERARITVTDQGEGIPVQYQERIFERFFRVDPSRDRTTGGTGLGLSIVKHVVRGCGGVVSVWSRPGVGSSFTILLPEWGKRSSEAPSRTNDLQRRTKAFQPATEGIQS